ncbi:MAG: hypothetical protein IT228_08160 [Flavobacteriales bacterium]|nr:hypothetical protein [Flavobacteriales bacterium]MCC6577301.1 hypothetical protein [Flavobacteriales bacterium]NUQ13742.1 hypothetical protein [Flavobacteriales bacterium]
MDLHTLLLKVHTAAGAFALGAAPLAMAVAKGGRWHRRWGLVFLGAITLTCISALLAGLEGFDPLLVLVALFSFHLAATGYRGLYLKGLHKGQRPGRWDLLMHGAAGVVYTGLLLWGVVHLLHGDGGPAALIPTTFGALGCVVVLLQVRRFHRNHHDKQEWLYIHMGGFLGSYIATVSAFSAANLDMIEPAWLRWLWPLLVGVPLVLVWTRHYRNRFDRGERPGFLGRLRIR